MLPQEREAAGAPAYLSSPADCAETTPLLAARDDGSGRQRWRLVEA